MASRTAPEAATPDNCIARLYAALDDDTSFEGPLRVAAGVFRSNVSGLHDEDFHAQRGRLTLIGGVGATDYAAFNRAYDAQWAGQNLWMERSLQGFVAQGYQHGEAVVAERELLRSPYYTHFLKPLDIHYGLGIRVCGADAPTMAIMSFHRPRSGRGFGADDVARVCALRPHLTNAYAIWRRTFALQARAASLRDAFERSACAALVLDGDARVVECNATAERIVFAAGVARRDRGRLAFAHGDTQRAFRDAMRRLAAGDAMPVSLRVAALAPHGAALVFHLCAVPRRALAPVTATGQVLAFVAELRPQAAGGLASAALQAVLGLTPAEARVAVALWRHVEIDDVARECGIAAATVRVHLKNLHRKAGVRRNAELVALVERVIASLPVP